MTFEVTGKKSQLTEERVNRTTEYMHKDIPDGTEVCILKHPLSVEEWDQILQNQKIMASLLELQDNSQQSLDHMQNVNFIIEHGKNKIKQIRRRISENEVKLESMESHSDYDYKDLLKELNEEEKEHEKDLKLFVDLLCKYNITIR
ncbi:hypothetical protein [Nitrosopumilus sp.]|uniref:hypothetical protein n=1 Tax=Nitrosopumilus sp. TaxID=2024843 RepID=UPI003B5AF49C